MFYVTVSIAIDYITFYTFLLILHRKDGRIGCKSETKQGKKKQKSINGRKKM